MQTLIWSATNLISALILPPGVFLVLIAVGLIAGRKRRWGRWLAGVALAAFALLSLNVVGYALLRPFEYAWPPLDPAREQSLRGEQAIIVVLGGGRTLGAIEYPGRETLASSSMRRTMYAARLAARRGLPLAVSGGSPSGGVLSEAVLMKNLLEHDLGRKVTVVEDQSFDTRQNAIYTAKALAEHRIGTVVLVTDVYHMPRAVRAFEAAGLKVVPAPMYFRASAPLDVRDFLPSTDGLELSQHVLREYVGAVWYALRRVAAR